MHRTPTISYGISTGAKLAAVAFICCLATSNTHVKAANTSIVADSQTKAEQPKVKTPENNVPDVLSPKDATAYRVIFEAQEQGDWDKADAAIAQLSDKILLGTVQADRFLRQQGNIAGMATWLKNYNTQPEATAIYDMANRFIAKNGKNMPKVEKLAKPQTPNEWNGGYAADTAADFSINLTAGQTASGSRNRKLAQDINKALRKDDPAAARNLLITAMTNDSLSGTFATDAEAAIGASFYYSGERDQARALTAAAAAANQPLGLWIRGLIAFEDNDMSQAGRHFSRLSEHPALNEGKRAAAAFWAWRSLNKAGENKTARALLEKAAKEPASFYGLLAAQMLGRNPVNTVTDNSQAPEWNAAQRAVLIAEPAGHRAMALLQVSQTARAEAELRRLNPQGRDDLRNAMLALASYVPMPALAVQIALLNDNRQDYTAALYPLPPWQPQHGFEVDRALMFALVRHESKFDPDAISARGARGLMQIMPATAGGLIGEISKTRSVANDNKLFDPAFNMAVGQKYVRHLAEQPQIGNNLLLLLAAYNSGPNKVARWKQARNTRDALLFMESMPVRETRNYITRVLPHYWAYRARLAEPLTSLRQMAEGQWPKLNLLDKAEAAEIVPATTIIKVASN